MSPALSDSAEVARWLRLVRRRLAEIETPKRGKALRVTFGFCFWTLLATCTGPHPSPLLGLWLALTLLIYETPLLAWALLERRFVRITLASDGTHSQLGAASLSTRRQLGLAIAGSFVCVLLGYSGWAFGPSLQIAGLGQATRLAIFWGTAQLLPLVPFKVGGILRAQLTLRMGLAHGFISLAVALATVAWFWDRLGLPLVLVGFGLWLSACIEELWYGRARWLDARASYAQRLNEIEGLISSDQARQALPIASEVLQAAHSAELRARAGKALAWAAIGSADLAPAHEAMARLPESALDEHLVAAYLATVNRTPEAVALLTQARRLGLRSRAASRLLADLYYREGDIEALAALARTDVDVLDADDLTRIEQAMSSLRTRASQPPPGSTARP